MHGDSFFWQRIGSVCLARARHNGNDIALFTVSARPDELAQMQAYRADMLQALAPLTSSATNGGSLSACVQHCHQNIDDVWLRERVGNQSVQEVRARRRARARAAARSSAPAPHSPRPSLVSQTFLRWYTGQGSALPLVIDGLYGQNTHCFGVPYACEW
jgi:hypothetical protein